MAGEMTGLVVGVRSDVGFNEAPAQWPGKSQVEFEPLNWAALQ